MKAERNVSGASAIACKALPPYLPMSLQGRFSSSVFKICIKGDFMAPFLCSNAAKRTKEARNAHSFRFLGPLSLAWRNRGMQRVMLSLNGYKSRQVQANLVYLIHKFQVKLTLNYVLMNGPKYTVYCTCACATLVSKAANVSLSLSFSLIAAALLSKSANERLSRKKWRREQGRDFSLCLVLANSRSSDRDFGEEGRSL